jgi:hypothetical protein
VATASSSNPQPGPDSPGRTIVVVACEVRRWRGYVSSEFYARRVDDLSTVATSGSFRWRKKASPPDRGSPRVAFDRLKAELVRLGWHDTGTHASWFEHRFERYEVAALAVLAEPVRVERRAPDPFAAPEESRAEVVVPVPVRLGHGVVEPSSVPGSPRSEAPVEADPPVPRAPQVDGPAHNASRPGRRRRWAAIAGAVLVAAGVAGGWFVSQSGRFERAAAAHRTATFAPVRSSQLRTSKAAAARVATGGATPAQGGSSSSSSFAPVVARLGVAASGPGSWLEVRQGSKRGRLLFAGVVAHGKHVHFAGRRLWVMFGAATNLAITVNGERRPLQGTVEAVVTSRGLAAP